MTTPRPTVSEVRTLLTCASPAQLPALLARFKTDDRAGVAASVASARRRLQAFRTEERRLDRFATAQRELHDAGIAVVAGLDEVGCGALAGPVTAGAVILSVDCRIAGIDDSKRLTPARREELDREIRARAVAVSVAHVWPADIDRIGIARAVEVAMREALATLGTVVDHALVDGRVSGLGLPTTSIVKGDGSVACIAAGSIVAKVARDAIMVGLEDEYPGYGFAHNKGYGSADHLAALAERGPSAVHRRSYAPCSQPRLFQPDGEPASGRDAGDQPAG